MSAFFADYDYDGKLGIYCTNIRSEHAWFAEAPTVRGVTWRIRGEGGGESGGLVLGHIVRRF